MIYLFSVIKESPTLFTYIGTGMYELEAITLKYTKLYRIYIICIITGFLYIKMFEFNLDST